MFKFVFLFLFYCDKRISDNQVGNQNIGQMLATASVMIYIFNDLETELRWKEGG